MSRTIEEAISTLTSLGGDAVSDRYHDFSQCLETLLLAEPQAVIQFETYHAALKHGFSYYYWKWDSRALDFYEPVNRAIERWGVI
ncbi:hypothetical protein BOSE62_71549 [Bosea sp. 62]|uniref:hypothetical protein n=1 Tax=unclassified Bosea (in: a-proteobacteria) TaxID=2653178 RepID=UPI00125844CA|nr:MULTISPECIES: hypothetical protein [unclassified Bosea (in: a-proteobacteria)]CAD5293084.1 hypothetical protein BOSE21B_90067 [Bosea sp. 21B]CAD5293647.1 hypothetical protein BOSE46_80176 [Bosea sp. 46]CAD5299493.1 hypothetical protein BOSE7B_60600 [Bosea sp. 7B]VVT62203.1 hypothetical protein BOS5A_30064 [Bosea sp. EC-HK365B]VXB09651.1 hypothetical protein BOSE125_120055 [Bosea sp. 125]